jgi:hypothetical protein
MIVPEKFPALQVRSVAGQSAALRQTGEPPASVHSLSFVQALR